VGPHSRDSFIVSSMVRILSKSDHGVDFGGKLKVIADRLSQSVRLHNPIAFERETTN